MKLQIHVTSSLILWLKHSIMYNNILKYVLFDILQTPEHKNIILDANFLAKKVKLDANKNHRFINSF